jgi:hypothetical protein
MRRLFVLFALGVMVVVCSRPASAQGFRPERPYRGLFGGGIGDTSQKVTANASAAAGYDDNLQAASRGSTTTGREDGISGTLTHMSGSIAYTANQATWSMGASLGLSGRYYPRTEPDFYHSTGGRLNFAKSLGERTSFTAGASATNHPYIFTTVFPTAFEPEIDEDLVPDPELVGSLENYLAYSLHANLAHKPWRRTSVTAGYNYRHADSPTGTREFIHGGLGGNISHSISRGLSVHGGYRYGKSRFEGREWVPVHTIDAGVNYHRALSFSRRTTLTFATGSTALQTRQRFHFIATGSVTLNHEIGRSWGAWVTYARRLLINEAWDEPLLSNGLSAGFGGLISRRLQFTSVARASLGRSVDDGPGRDYDAYTAHAALNYAISRFASAGVTYAYYFHDYGFALGLPPGFANHVDRQSVRARISVWAPLFYRARRTDASR